MLPATRFVVYCIGAARRAIICMQACRFIRKSGGGGAPALWGRLPRLCEGGAARVLRFGGLSKFSGLYEVQGFLRVSTAWG